MHFSQDEYPHIKLFKQNMDSTCQNVVDNNMRAEKYTEAYVRSHFDINIYETRSGKVMKIDNM